MVFRSINEILRQKSTQHPERTALVCEGRNVTYRQFYELVTGRASFLGSQSLQSRVGLLGLNSIEFYVNLLALCALGKKACVLNWRLQQSELLELLRRFDVHEIIAGPEQDLVHAGRVSMEGLSSVSQTIFEPQEDDVFAVLFTSGTTGHPRGVPISHANMLALIQQAHLEIPELSADSVNFVCTPNFHISGMGYFLLGLYCGCKTILLPRFEPALVVKALKESRATHTLMVPAMLQALLASPELDSLDLASLKHIMYGASPISHSLLVLARQKLKTRFTQGYGLTETTGLATLLRFDDHEAVFAAKEGEAAYARAVSAGRPAAGMDVVIRDGNGRPLPAGEIGEVFVRGPTVFQGYLDEPSSLAADGFFATGDAGYVDSEGFLFLVDRIKDLIITGGENVYPAEVERVIAAYPGIAEAAVFGIPDETYGESVCAAVVPVLSGDGTKANINEALLLSHLKERLAGYKIPRKIVLHDVIPRNAAGKVLRRVLREPYWSAYQRRIH